LGGVIYCDNGKVYDGDRSARTLAGSFIGGFTRSGPCRRIASG
jgi:hypothetical protein